MPNWCMNNVYVTNKNHDKLLGLLAAYQDGNLFNLIVPLGEEYDRQVAIDKWGTKWDATPNGYELNGDTLFLSFETAWSPPIGVYQALEVLGYEVSGRFFEPGMALVGRYASGKLETFEFDPDTVEHEVPHSLIDEFDIHSWFVSE